MASLVRARSRGGRDMQCFGYPRCECGRDIIEAISENHYKDMMEIIKSKSKLDAINGEDFRKVQDYFHDKSVENSRMAFRIRTEMVKEIPGNFKTKYPVRGIVNEGLICLECQEQAVMTQSHCITCPA
jgi:hypothetical protein